MMPYNLPWISCVQYRNSQMEGFLLQNRRDVLDWQTSRQSGYYIQYDIVQVPTANRN